MDDVNPYFELATQFVNQTNRHLFLTGKAGTGKTTFLRYIAEKSFKKMAIVAPTGVAAINAGGVTLHSLFQLPFGPFLPGYGHEWKGNIQFNTVHTLFKNLRMSSAKRELLRELDLLVIDEVSMLRADTLDEVDAVLRHFRKRPYEPFGGLQMLYIGDLFQLPPVVNGEEWSVLKNYYRSPFFFDAHVLKESPPLYIELKKIYRQHDEEFISILNNIRNNEASEADINRLHQHYRPSYEIQSQGEVITLTTHNAKADTINRNKLEQLPGKVFNYRGEISGEFPDRALPAEMVLQLKEGAQVMFIKNDKGESRRYYNGKLATITKLTGDSITVKFKDDRSTLELEKEEWKNIRYNYDRGKDTIEEDELGTYKQYPIRLAWAITIHKSQGLTFEKAIVDAGESFAAGQVYVALSRLTSLDGLTLYSKIRPVCIDTDERVLEFARSEKSNELLIQELSEGQQQYFSRLLIQCFRWNAFSEQVQEHYESYEDREIPNKETCLEWAGQLAENVKEQQEMADKFIIQLDQILQSASTDKFRFLHTRVSAAHGYFMKGLEDLLESVRRQSAAMRIKSKTKRYITSLGDLTQIIQRRVLAVRQAQAIVDALLEGHDLKELPARLNEVKIIPNAAEDQTITVSPRPKKGETFSITLQMFKEGKSISMISELRGLAVSTIEGHLSKSVVEGEIAIEEIVEHAKVATILKALNETDIVTVSSIREKLGANYSFGEIRAVINHHERLKKLNQG